MENASKILVSYPLLAATFIWNFRVTKASGSVGEGVSLGILGLSFQSPLGDHYEAPSEPQVKNTAKFTDQHRLNMTVPEIGSSYESCKKIVNGNL